MAAYSSIFFRGTVDSIAKSNICNIGKTSLTGRFGVISTSKKVNENIPLQWASSFKNFIHSGNAKEFEAGGDSRNPEIGRPAVDRGMDNGWNPRNNKFVRRSTVDPNMNSELLSDRANFGRPLMGVNRFSASDAFLLPQVNIEKDGDIVHIKMLKNNCFITVTDSKGNKKFGSTTGRAEKGAGKIRRFSAEAVAEQMGREARERGIKSVVIKINGFTYFTQKKRAILSFREGYSHSRLDRNPIVYVEDKTRRAHNGCRLRKSRRL